VSFQRRPRGRESGQALVVMLGVILAAVALVALIVDGGNAFTQQRVTQTGSDATAESGAILLAKRLAGSSTPSGGWDATIADAIQATAAANNMTVQAAYYTDICGIPLKANGSAALSGNVEDLSSAVAVGNLSHVLPGGSATTPDCPSLQVGPVAGVLVIGQKIFPTFVARAINIKTFTVTTRATAVAGYLQGYCDASQGNACAILPVAIPVNSLACDGSNPPINSGHPWNFSTVYKIPLCSNGPGNVGWLDWTPPNGGTPELVDSILIADNPAIDLPSWQYMTSTGNPNKSEIEDALRTYNGQVVLIPQFDLTCNPGTNQSDPDSTTPAIVTGPNYGCPSGALGGNGQNQWYRMPSFAFFQMCAPSLTGCDGLEDAYTNGSNQAECDTGSGATSCIIGKFVDILGSGTVGAGVGSGTGNKAVGVQLIK
jgi:hypothetical protein